MGTWRKPESDVYNTVSENTRARKHTPRRNPCERPPGKPDLDGQPPVPGMNFKLDFRVREAKTHLEFMGFCRWNEQDLDTNGLPLDPGRVDRYQVQMKATTDEAGEVPALDDEGEPILIEKHRNPRDPAKDDDDPVRYHVYFGHMARPKTWYRSARIRVRAGKGCWSEWSDWTPPVLPWFEADPKPPTPEHLSMVYDVERKARHGRFRAIVTFDEVGPWDVPGGDTEDDMKAYVVQLQRAELGAGEVEGNWTDWKRDRMRAAKDKDEDTIVKTVFHNVRKRYVYRVRVRSIDRFNRRGDWSEWYYGGQPGDTTPIPAPTGVTLDVDQHKFHVTWDVPEESAGGPGGTNDHIPSYDVDYSQVEIATDAGFTSVIRHDYKVKGENKTFRAVRPGASPYYARVRCVSSTEGTSEWAPTSATKNTPSTPAAPSVSFDTKGTRHARYRALVTVATVSPTDHEINKYVVQLAHDASSGASPPAGAKRQHGRVEGNATDDDLTEVFRNIPRRHYVWARVRAVDTEGKRSVDFSPWTPAGRPMDSASGAAPDAPTDVNVANPSPRRFVVTWTDPADDEAVRWRVQIVNQNGVKETGWTRTNRYVYRAPKTERRLTHTANVYAINDLGVESSQPGFNAMAGMDDDVAAEEIGSIKLWGHGTVPTGWWRCNGAAKSTTGEGAALFGVIYYNYGGSGGTYYLPDYRKRGVRGVGDSTGTGSEGATSLGDTDGLLESSRIEYAGQHQAHGRSVSQDNVGDHVHGSGTLAIPDGTQSSGNIVENVGTEANARKASTYVHGHTANSFNGLTGRQQPPGGGPEIGGHNHNVDVSITGVVDQAGVNVGHGHKKKSWGRAHYIIKYA